LRLGIDAPGGNVLTPCGVIGYDETAGVGGVGNR
jgi:hypothetical protein